MTAKADLLQGSLDLLILKTLELEPLHGWAVSKRIQLLSRGVLGVDHAMYFSYVQRSPPSVRLAVRTRAGGVPGLGGRLRDILADLDPSGPARAP